MKRATVVSAILLGFVAAPCLADDTKTKSHEVKAGPFHVKVELDGVFVSEKMTEVAIYPKQWSDFSVVEAAAHGQVVHKGETIVQFDETDLADAIADMEAEQRLAELTIIQAERNIPLLENSLALAQKSAERSTQYAELDLQRFIEVDRPLSERAAAFRLKSTQNYLEYATEELEQLEKMYEADDLTEESEEIVLKRQRDSVESAQFSVERQKIGLEETLQVELPREDVSHKHAVEMAKLAHERAKLDSELKASQKRFELEKTKHARARSLEKHAKLLADRELMTVHAPVDGVVYYGQCVDGKWPGIQTQMKSLRPKGSVVPESVFMTIVSPRPVKIVAQIVEKDLAGFEKGLAARIQPTANPNARIEGRIGSVSTVPIAEGKFGVELSLGPQGSPDWIVPGMACKVAVTTYQQESALTIPAKALHTDKADSAVKYVFILGDEGTEPRRQTVTVGKKSGDTVEIVTGLAEGDRVALGDVEKK